MKNLESIIKKYSELSFNSENYSIGGGLSSDSFASNRHKDAKYDEGKETFGKVCQMFKKATDSELDFVKDVIKYAVPNMEWHHAGKLPKSYGGGMKKTYFLNAKEIVMLAEKWNDFVEKLEISNEQKRIAETAKKTKEQLKHDFLTANAKRVIRVSERPELFYETDKEMNGKYGWFSSYGKPYNMPEYYTGWVFESMEKLNEFYSL